MDKIKTITIEAIKALDLTLFERDKLNNANKLYENLIGEYTSNFQNSNYTNIVNTEYVYDIIINSKVIIFEWTLDILMPTKYVSQNISQFGYTPEDFYTGKLKDYWEFVHPDDRKRTKKNIYDVRKTMNDEYIQVYRIITKDKKIRWVEEHLSFNRNKEGRAISEKGIIFDITETINLQHELVKSKERYKRIFDNSSVMIFTIAMDGRILTVNKMFVKVLGYSHNEIIGTKAYKLIPQSFCDENKLNSQKILDMIKNTIEKQMSIDVVCKNGEIKTLGLTSNVIDNDGNEIEIVAQDISEKKKAEEKIKYLTFRDKLTNVYNRSYYEEAIDDFERLKIYPFSVVMGDINGLKEINDNYGHKKGDEVLKCIADIIVSSSREHDIVCRIGGDEFAVICPETDENGVRKLCERIRERCEDIITSNIEKPSIALGFATKYSDLDNIETILKTADDNMYRNKLTLTKSTRGFFVKSLQLALEENSVETIRHSNRVKNIALIIGKRAGLSDLDLNKLSATAILHDIGKIGIPSSIMKKPNELTELEYQVVKSHSFIGYNLLRISPSTKSISEYVLYHHERIDGTGYPDGLKGKNIPLISRIINVADAFDVMTHKCPYKKKVSVEEALSELKRCSNKQFDAVLVAHLIEHFKESVGDKVCNL